jgi:hypothetical protein
VALALAVAVGAFGAVDAIAALVHTGAKYSGSTAQHHRISFRVSTDGTQVTGFKTTIDYVCTHGTQTSGGFTSRPISIHHAKFNETTKAHGVSGGAAVKSAVSMVSGMFEAHGKASGRIRETATLQNGLKCDSGKVTFRVSAGA